MNNSSENRFVVARLIARAINRRTTTAPAYFHLSAGAPKANEQLLWSCRVKQSDNRVLIRLTHTESGKYPTPLTRAHRIAIQLDPARIEEQTLFS